MARGTRKNFGGSGEKKKYPKHVPKSSHKSRKFRRGSTEPRPFASEHINARGKLRRETAMEEARMRELSAMRQSFSGTSRARSKSLSLGLNVPTPSTF